MRRKALLLALIGALVVVVAASAARLPTGPADGTGETRYLVLMIVYAGVALVFSFLCSVAEAVLLSVSPSFIAHLRQQGKPLAERLQRIKSSIDRSLAAILTLNTIAHTVGAGGAGAEAASYFGERWVGLAMAVLTLLILFVSEIVPKTLGAVYWRALAGPTAAFVRMLIVTLYPLIWISELLTKLITRGRPVHTFSREEFAALADVGVERGQIEIEESRIVKNLFRFRELRVEAIMTPRTVVFALQQDLTVDAALAEHADTAFSRILIYSKNLDDVRAFVLKNDLMREKLAGRGSSRLRELGREVQAVSEKASLEAVFERLLDNRLHLLLVVDEYGGLAGLVTLEDVVETLLGMEIVDEADETDDLRQLARQRWEERRRRMEQERR
ncbi:MAG: CNNM domain-containing protein [Thermoanaerobaculia bacterium]